ncbi:ASCH domain-containing protein [Anabaena sp. UHCC 0253]|uniref:ASCH domain-containing protein n=1 Tax=Anabaena sp. UHCC 0253 TaxID=2590019 RepID=UPI001447A9C7|nr:ASCH domain-containing protein [Anabaena sp. UHCC 0253]MTJ56015.1 ASCH domain-containing protein [Anabaena sp. UHCC 0253]
MKALSLWQPWATLIEKRVKWVETRSWNTNYRGQILICSAKKKDKYLKEFHYNNIRPILYDLFPVSSSKLIYHPDFRFFEYDDLPLGMALCIANLKDCKVMTPQLISQQSKVELAFGNWEEGRFAWIFDNITPLSYPFPVQGKQGLFDVAHDSLD